MRAKKILFILSFIVLGHSFTSGQSWDWARQAQGLTTGNGGENGTGGNVIAVDSFGNTYLTGIFNDTLIFDNDSLFAPLFNYNYDPFLVKYDSGGNEIWAKQGKNIYTGFSSGNAVTIDKHNNVYLFGAGQHTKFGPDTISGSYIIKYSPAGSMDWIISYPAPNISINSGQVDKNQFIYITGSFSSGTVLGNDTLITIGSGTYTAKLDSVGNPIWAKQSNNSPYVTSNYVYYDMRGNVYVAGDYNDSVSFDSIKLFGGSEHSTYFLTKYDKNGKLLWVRQSGFRYDNESCVLHSIVAGNSGDVYLTGQFSDSVKFGNYVLKESLDSLQDFFIVKYDSNGNVKWAYNGACVNKIGFNSCLGWDISVDMFQNIYITIESSKDGFIYRNDTLHVIYDCNPLTIMKLDTAGNLLCSSTVISGGYQGGLHASLDGKSVLVGGNIKGGKHTIFDSDTLYSEYYNLPFLAKWQPNNHTVLSTDLISQKYSSLFIFPNPSTGKFTIQLSGFNDQWSIEIYNEIGEKVYTKDYKTLAISHQLDLSTQPNGIYFYRVIDESGKMIGEGKLVIDR